SRASRKSQSVFNCSGGEWFWCFLEPASDEAKFAPGFGEWKQRQQANGYDPEIWERFWARVNALLCYDHTPLPRNQGTRLIGADGISVSEWARLLESAGSEPAMFSWSTEKLVEASANPLVCWPTLNSVRSYSRSVTRRA